MNNLISYGWGTDLPIGSFVNNIHMRILSNAEKFFNKVVLIDTTWLGEENINQVYNQINEISPTIIIICSFIDATFITEQNFKQFDIPVVSIGNFNNQKDNFMVLDLFNETEKLKKYKYLIDHLFIVISAKVKFY